MAVIRTSYGTIFSKRLKSCVHEKPRRRMMSFALSAWRSIVFGSNRRIPATASRSRRSRSASRLSLDPIEASTEASFWRASRKVWTFHAV
jgi:hypothetical protein